MGSQAVIQYLILQEDPNQQLQMCGNHFLLSQSFILRNHFNIRYRYEAIRKVYNSYDRSSSCTDKCIPETPIYKKGRPIANLPST